MAFDLQALDDIGLLVESGELECKLAQGQDGKGELPRDFWSTYSAFANTHGGVVLLGIREVRGRFSVAGIEHVEKVRSDLFNTLNNPTKVSVNLLRDSDVTVRELDGKTILVVQIPAATRKQKPVFLNGQPLGNTFRRLHDGDRRCDEESVRRMFAEQVEDSRDNRILPGFGLADLDLESLHAYRNMFSVQKPDHPWNAPDDLSFLRLLGGWRKDRHTGEQGLTLAGLLMFGQWQNISEAVPLYFLDYREQDDQPSDDTRWLDRVVPDGSWSGNLFDFFRKVSRKLVADLKVPFVLKDGFRQDDTPLHQVLREALVNTLVHADYSDRASVRIIKRPSGFEFRNPGLMRVPAKAALHGGESDCRNRTLHQMFLMINLGERAGSGLPKIREAWQAAGGSLELSDSFEPYDQTLLRMSWPSTASAGLVGSSDRASEKTSEKTSEKASEKTSEETSEETAARILALLLSEPTLSARKLAGRLGLSARAIELQLARLKAKGKLQRIGPAKGGYWQVVTDGKEDACQ